MRRRNARALVKPRASCRLPAPERASLEAVSRPIEPGGGAAAGLLRVAKTNKRRIPSRLFRPSLFEWSVRYKVLDYPGGLENRCEKVRT
jgi:hypothetical protein